MFVNFAYELTTFALNAYTVCLEHFAVILSAQQLTMQSVDTTFDNFEIVSFLKHVLGTTEIGFELEHVRGRVSQFVWKAELWYSLGRHFQLHISILRLSVSLE